MTPTAVVRPVVAEPPAATSENVFTSLTLAEDEEAG
jgi:hypothetical protein